MELSLRKQQEWHQLRSWAKRVHSGELVLPSGTRLNQREMLALGNDVDSRDPEAREALRELAAFRALEAAASQVPDPAQRIARKLESQWQRSGMFQRLEDARTNHVQALAGRSTVHSLAAKLEHQELPSGIPEDQSLAKTFARRVRTQLTPAPDPGAQVQEIRILLEELAILLRAWNGGERSASTATRKRLAAVRQIQAVA